MLEFFTKSDFCDTSRWFKATLTWLTFGVPSTHDDPPVLRILLDGVDDFLQLVDTLSGVICPKKRENNNFGYPAAQQAHYKQEESKNEM